MPKAKSNAALWERAGQVMVGGVNSPVRAFGSVANQPRFYASGQGGWLTDVQGKRYLDCVGSWGAAILGHAHPTITQAVAQQLQLGMSFGACHELEVDWAEWICANLPWVERVRMTCSGTEAAMTALRLARGYTRRDCVVKFDGCYHGHVDSLLVKAGSGALTGGEPDSAGVPKATAAQTLQLPFNDSQSLRDCFAAHGDKIAAVILEVVPGNMGMVWPDPEFLQTVQQTCRQQGALLIADEVMTGFRVGFKGACGLLDLSPDLIMLGKVVGGGMPCATVGGRQDIMEHLAPLGAVYQAGTLAGHPLAVAAGLAALRELDEMRFSSLDQRTTKLCTELEKLAQQRGIELSTLHCGGMFGIYFASSPPSNLQQAQQLENGSYGRFFSAMLDRGVNLAPSPYESAFWSLEHGDAEHTYFMDCAEAVLSEWEKA